MTQPRLVPHPPDGFVGQLVYRAKPSHKRSFRTVLDAGQMLAEDSVVSVGFDRVGDGIEVAVDIALRHGRLRDHTRFDLDLGGLSSASLERTLVRGDGETVRTESVTFHEAVLALPKAAYPEVVLPHILGWFPDDGERRSLFAWINDRFVARVYVERVRGAAQNLDLPVGRVRALEHIMYPDLNDWVSMGDVLTRLAKPFLPKYRMWFAVEPPFRLVRFEGPYGPPGAPEIILELISGSS